LYPIKLQKLLQLSAEVKRSPVTSAGPILLIMLSFALALLLAGGAASEVHQRGVQLYKQQKYADAIAELQQAAESEDPSGPDYKESALLIGQSYFMMSEAPKAIPWLEKVTNVNEANYMLGYAYLQNKQPDESEAAFARLFGVKPDSAAGHLLAAQMLVKHEYESYAEAEARKALALDPKLPGAHFLLGEIALYGGRIDEGIGEMNRELEINPGSAMAWYRRGDGYTRQEKWDTAIPDLQRAVWLNPDYSGPYILLGKCYFKTANYSNAEGILRRALAIDPGNASANYLLAQTLSAEGKKDEAKMLLDKVRAMKEGH
jgi:tetratricopeptide (TPR) repeat protein